MLNSRPLRNGLLAATALAALVSAAHEAAARSTPAAHSLEFTISPAALPANYLAAATAARSNDLAKAESRLSPLLSGSGDEARRARVVLGLLAYDARACERAERWLASGPGPTELEDWRLFGTADCAAELGAVAEARGALERLLSSMPDSPLRARTVVRLAELAWSAGDSAQALTWVERGRSNFLSEIDAAKLEELAWTIGRATGDRVTETEAARRLLVRAPLAASKLAVAAALSARGILWQELLGPAELFDRSDALLRAEVPQGALITLDAVPESERRFRYRLLRARALIATQQGAAAEAELALARPGSTEEAARLELLRADAAEEHATVRSGRTNPPVEERLRLRSRAEAARGRAAELAGQAGNAEVELRALRALYIERDSQGRYEEAIELLRRIVRLAPGDTLGARPLWERGWRAYLAGNASGAVGYWRELTTLYPAISYARQSQYWTARALDRLGERDRARSAYLEIASSPTRDFYARQAGLRLSGATLPAADEPSAIRDPWPADPRFARAERLSEYGLDRLALIEVDELAAGVEPRVVAAIRGRALAQTGDWRASLRELRKAFPNLGTARQASVPRDALELYYPRPFDERVQRFARAQNLPTSLVFGIVHQESGFDAAAVSRSGARGLMQLMPATAKELSQRLKIPYSARGLLEPEISLRLGTTYFRQMLGLFDDRVELALASYNGGPGRIGRLWRQQGATREVDFFLEDLSLEESRNYVKRILLLAESYRSLYSDLS